MRFTGLSLAILLTVGCGADGRAPHTIFGTGLTPPALMDLSPKSVPVNSVPFALIVNGANFRPDALVFWNDAPQSTRFLSSQQLQVAVTEADLMQFGLAHIFVRTGGLNSNTVDFDVTAQ